MPSKQEKLRLRAIVRAVQQEERDAEEAEMPLSKPDLKALLVHLEKTLFEERSDGKLWWLCDHTLKRTRAYLQSRQLPEATIVEWLHDYGGFCDCEVSANVGGTWEERLEQKA